MKVVCPVSGTENEDRIECKQCGTDLRPLIQIAEFPLQLILEGTESLTKGRYLEAIESLEAAVSLDPDSADAHWRLGEAFAGLRQFDVALSHIDRALQIAPAREDLQEIRQVFAKSAGDVNGNVAPKIRTRPSALSMILVAVAGCVFGLLLTIGGQGLLHSFQPRPNWSQVIEKRLAADPVTRGLNLKVDSHDGTVQIAGQVPSDIDRQLVLEICCHKSDIQIDAAQLQVTPPPHPLIYQVRPGDSWWRIARREYGTAIVWSQIEEANQHPHSALGQLKKGETVLLPPVTLAPK
jgi:tetratricopeptide (TPR) repeat protein